MSNSRCLAVMYHYVRDRADGPERGIRGLNVATFRLQLDVLCEALEPIDWPTFMSWRDGVGSIPERSFLLTFDDGLADHADVVCPILEARGLRGVFLVSTEPLAEGRLATAHALHLLLCRVDDDVLLDEVRNRATELAGDDATRHGVNRHEAMRLYHYESPVRAELKYLLTREYPIELSDRIVAELFTRHVGNPATYASQWYLKDADLVAMQAAGHTIGGHGHRHVPYARLTPLDQAADMQRCATELSRRLGSRPRPFSYPFGSADEATVRACKLNGFVNGFTTHPGWIDADQDPHRLQRVDTIDVQSFLERELLCREA